MIMLLLDVVYIRILKVLDDVHPVSSQTCAGAYSVDIIGCKQHECRLSEIFYPPCSPTIHYDDLIITLATILSIVRELPRQSGSRTGLQPPLPLASLLHDVSLRTRAQSWHLRLVPSRHFPLAFSLYQNYFLAAVLALCLSPGLLLTRHTIVWITTLCAHKHCCPSEDPPRATIPQWELCPAIFVRSTRSSLGWYCVDPFCSLAI